MIREMHFCFQSIQGQQSAAESPDPFKDQLLVFALVFLLA